MDSALLVITEKLKETGMSTIEVDHLLARFLEEEAFDFVKYVEVAMEEFELDFDCNFKSLPNKYLS